MRKISTIRTIAGLGLALGLLSVFAQRDWRTAGWLVAGTCAAIAASALNDDDGTQLPS